jgi:hypothetical protein
LASWKSVVSKRSHRTSSTDLRPPTDDIRGGDVMLPAPPADPHRRSSVRPGGYPALRSAAVPAAPPLDSSSQGP